jgi:hypothetical protein
VAFDVAQATLSLPKGAGEEKNEEPDGMLNGER